MNVDAMIWLSLLVSIASGALAGYVAKEKGYVYGSWFVSGLFFSILALIAVAGLPDRARKMQTNFESNLPPLE